MRSAKRSRASLATFSGLSRRPSSNRSRRVRRPRADETPSFRTPTRSDSRTLLRLEVMHLFHALDVGVVDDHTRVWLGVAADVARDSIGELERLGAVVVEPDLDLTAGAIDRRDMPFGDLQAATVEPIDFLNGHGTAAPGVVHDHPHAALQSAELVVGPRLAVHEDLFQQPEELRSEER